MPRKTIFDLQFNLLNAGNFVPIPGGPQLPFTIVGTHNHDVLVGTRGNDVINGLGGEDVLFGKNGDDWIFGGRSNDLLNGDAGNDHLYGEEGDDIFDGDVGNDVVHGGNGDDWGSGWDGDDAIYGDAGDDVIGGSDGNDLVDGGDGNDDLYGGLGEDTLYGAAGNDILDDVKEANGLSGHDWFYGGDGDDRLITGSLMKALTMGIFDGGSGFDRLELATTGAIKNIGGLAQVTEGIEAIGLGYAWDATLVVNPKDVLDFSDSHVLYVTGGHDGKVWPAQLCGRQLDRRLASHRRPRAGLQQRVLALPVDRERPAGRSLCRQLAAAARPRGVAGPSAAAGSAR